MKTYIDFFTEKNVPTNPKKWKYWVGQAKKKFDVYPSAYANGWAVRMYTLDGGKWKAVKEDEIQDPKQEDLDDFFEPEKNEDLGKWFKDKWVNIGKTNKDGSHPPCGTSGDKQGYAKCVPLRVANRMTDKEKRSAVRRKREAHKTNEIIKS